VKVPLLINLASFGSSGLSCSALGRLEFNHPHALSGVLYIAPPPPFNKQPKKQKNIAFSLKMLIILAKTPSAIRNGFFICGRDAAVSMLGGVLPLAKLQTLKLAWMTILR